MSRTGISSVQSESGQSESSVVPWSKVSLAKVSLSKRFQSKRSQSKVSQSKVSGPKCLSPNQNPGQSGTQPLKSLLVGHFDVQNLFPTFDRTLKNQLQKVLVIQSFQIAQKHSKMFKKNVLLSIKEGIKLLG